MCSNYWLAGGTVGGGGTYPEIIQDIFFRSREDPKIIVGQYHPGV